MDREWIVYNGQTKYKIHSRKQAKTITCDTLLFRIGLLDWEDLVVCTISAERSLGSSNRLEVLAESKNLRTSTSL